MRFGVVGRRLPVSASQVGAAAKCRLCGASTLVQCGRHKFFELASAAVDNTHEVFTVIHFQSNPSCAVQTICNGPSATHTASASTFPQFFVVRVWRCSRGGRLAGNVNANTNNRIFTKRRDVLKLVWAHWTEKSI